MQSPEKVARAIVKVVERPRRSRYVPRWIAIGLAIHAVVPTLSERLLLAALRRWHISEVPQLTGAGNLFEPPRDLACTHGTRPPMLRLPTMIGWMLVRAIRFEVATVLRTVRRWRTA